MKNLMKDLCKKKCCKVEKDDSCVNDGEFKICMKNCAVRREKLEKNYNLYKAKIMKNTLTCEKT